MSSMSAADFMPGKRTATLDAAASELAHALRFVAAVIVGLVKAVAPHIFTIGAFAAFSYAAFLYATPLGFVIVGVCLLLLEWKVRHE